MRWSISLVVFASGCIHTIEEHESRVGDIERDCVVPIPAGVTALGAPVSIELDDASVWMWESLALTDGSTVANAAARMPRVGDTCARPPELAMDVTDSIRSILALSPDELADNAARTDGRRLALVPTGGFAHDGLGYLFYDHVVRGPGFFDEDRLGTGLCVLDPKRQHRGGDARSRRAPRARSERALAPPLASIGTSSSSAFTS